MACTPEFHAGATQSSRGGAEMCLVGATRAPDTAGAAKLGALVFRPPGSATVDVPSPRTRPPSFSRRRTTLLLDTTRSQWLPKVVWVRLRRAADMWAASRCAAPGGRRAGRRGRCTFVCSSRSVYMSIPRARHPRVGKRDQQAALARRCGISARRECRSCIAISNFSNRVHHSGRCAPRAQLGFPTARDSPHTPPHQRQQPAFRTQVNRPRPDLSRPAIGPRPLPKRSHRRPFAAARRPISAKASSTFPCPRLALPDRAIPP